MSTGRRRPAALAAGLAVALAMAGCGTQLSEERLQAGVGAEPVVGGSALDATQPVVGAPTGVVDTGTTAGVPASGAVIPQATTGAAAAPAAGKGAKNSPGTASGGAAPTAATGPSTACTQSLAPVIIGQTLAASGIVGSVILNLRTALQVWAKDLNARGGLQCHPVQIISLDDASDSAKVAANMRELANRGAIAVLGAGVPIATGALHASADQLKLPVIGGDQVGLDWNQSPYMFPAGADILSTLAGAMREAALATGGKTVGLVYCVEASTCGAVNDNMDRMSKQAGLSVVAKKGTSLTQTDYTAECQAMKNAKAEILFIAMDGSAASRVARSCNGIGYNPPIAATGFAAIPSVLADPNVQKDTLYLGAAQAPYLAEDSPALAEFQAAMAKSAPGVKLDQSAISGWASGKLLEAALGNVAAKARAGALTKDLVLDGLGAVKKETLAGLTAPMTFTKGKPAPVVPCYYLIRVDEKGPSAPKGSKPQCLPS